MRVPNRASFHAIATFVILALAMGCGTAPSGSSPQPADISRDGLMAYFAAEARKVTDRAKSEASSREAWDAVRDQRRHELREMLGLAGNRPRTPLNVQVTGSVEREGYVVEKVAFESMPKVYVTANLYLPTVRDGPVPGVVYVCGHAYSPYGAKTSYQRHGHTLARHGYAAMVIDPIQIAETAGLHHGVWNQEMYEWYTRAYSPAGLEVWNVIRALDYLETRPEIDSARLAITGRSGGAAMSWFAASVEPRIKVAIPIMGIATYAVTVPDNTQQRHCDCMYPVNFHQHDLTHLGALIAPRPLLTAHGRLDPLFPVAGYEEFSTTMATLYSSYEVPEMFRNLVVESGHEDSDLLRAEAVKWLDRWLMEREERGIDTTYTEIDAAELAVFGGSPPEDALNYRAHEFFVDGAKHVEWEGDSEWTALRDRLRRTLREDVLGAIPDDAALTGERAGRLEARSDFESVAFDYDGGVEVQALIRVPDEPVGPALLHVAGPGEDPQAVQLLLRNLPRFGNNPLMVVYPPGTGASTWPKSDWKMLLRNAMHTGSTVDTVRIGSVLAAVKALRSRAGSDRRIAISGIGPAAGWALYVAALDESISQAILVRAPDSHLDGPVLLGALRHVDLPDVAALVAPRRLTFYGAMPGSYDRTRQIYTDLGVEDRISVSMSIGAALNGRFDHGFSIGL